MLNSVKANLINIIEQAKTGTVIIGPQNDPTNQWRYFVKFATKINGSVNLINEDTPCISIHNFDVFLSDFEKYLKLAKEFYKNEKEYYNLDDNTYEQKLILSLFINSSFHEMSDFNQYILKRIEAFQTNILTDTFKIGEYNDLSIQTKIGKNMTTLESPYKFCPFFSDDKESFYLPQVYFSVNEDIVNILGIQNKNTDQNNALTKKLDRYFRKVDKGLDTEDALCKVSPNALVSLTLFLSCLKQQGLTKIVAPDYLPIRYNASEVMFKNKFKDINKINDRLEKLDRDQYNMTNKFMTLFLRYAHHFDESYCDYDDISQQMKMKLNNNQQKFDNILYDLDKSVKLNQNFIKTNDKSYDK